MKMPPFAYRRAESLAQLFDLLDASGPEARILAGGQSLLATLAFRLSEPSTLIDITRIDALRGVAASDGVIRIGALTTHAEIARDPVLAQACPVMAQAARLIAHPAIRNRGTIGGSLAYADPAAEWPAVMVALGATIIVAGRLGERRIPAAGFFLGAFMTGLADGEAIVAVEVPRLNVGEAATILELARRSGDYAMAGLVLMTGPGMARAVFFGVGNGPVLAAGASAVLAEGRGIEAAQAALPGDLDPPPDLSGGPAFKRHLCRVLLGRAVAWLDAPLQVAA